MTWAFRGRGRWTGRTASSGDILEPLVRAEPGDRVGHLPEDGGRETRVESTDTWESEVQSDTDKQQTGGELKLYRRP